MQGGPEVNPSSPLSPASSPSVPAASPSGAGASEDAEVSADSAAAAQALVVERLGAYLGTYSVGIHFLVPFIDRVAKKVNLKEQVEDFPPQPVITQDNVTMQIDTEVFFYITDTKLYAYGVERPLLAIENLTATTLRNIKMCIRDSVL